MIEPLESIEQGIATADIWEKKGDLPQMQRCIEGALMGYLQHAVRQPSFAEAVALLREHDMERLLDRCLRGLTTLCDDVDAGRWPSSVIAGNYDHIVFSHVAWALGNRGQGVSFAEIARRADVLELSTPFWQEYSRGVEALLRGESYVPREMRLRSHEKYWVSYLGLISAASRGEPLDAAIQEVDVAFRRRNEQGKIDGDSYGIEGCADDPVRWDFRRDGLLAFIRRPCP